MAVPAKEVKKLRDSTGVGMMDCKKALVETDGDFERAIDLLRKLGQKVAAKRSNREAKEGLIITGSAPDSKTAILVEINCETDFVARNQEFQDFASSIGNVVLNNLPADRDALLALDLNGHGSISDALITMTGKVGEKIEIRRHAVAHSENGTIVSYIHPGSRLGVLVDISGDGDHNTTGRDVAMQVAALNPIATRREEVPSEITDKEVQIAREAAILDGKPEQIVDRIASGKLERYYKDNVLLEQPFVKDSSQSVKEMLAAGKVEIKSFIRFVLGE